MLPIDHFRHCPNCGVPAAPGKSPFRCPACPFTYYFNPTVSAGAFLSDCTGRRLVIRRAKEPGRGLLGVPGGFIDIGETAEEALRRETLEEVGVTIADIRYVCSCTNLYPYAGVLYPVVDVIFTALAVNPEAAEPLDGVAGLAWLRPAELNEGELAFPSLMKAWKLLKKPLPQAGGML